MCRVLEDTIIGRNCDQGLQEHGMTLVKGVNDTVFCGRVM